MLRCRCFEINFEIQSLPFPSILPRHSDTLFPPMMDGTVIIMAVHFLVRGKMSYGKEVPTRSPCPSSSFAEPRVPLFGLINDFHLETIFDQKNKREYLTLLLVHGSDLRDF